MYRRLGARDLQSTNPFLHDEEGHSRFVWRVYENYEVVDPEGGLPYLQATATSQHTKRYQPFTDAPYLVLDFARIAENKNPAEALQRWINKYGLLGLLPEDSTYVVKELPQIVRPPRRCDDRGGPSETLDAVWYEVEIINETLLLYEAALNRDVKKLERLILTLDRDQEHIERRRMYLEKAADEAGREWIDALINGAMAQIWEYTAWPLNFHTFPTFGTKDDFFQKSLLPVNGLTASWGMRSLLGVMYLQLYWLVTSGGKLSRCKQCKDIIAHGHSISINRSATARKPRKDKEFCSSRCRQNYHYHTRIKPERKGGGGGR